MTKESAGGAIRDDGSFRFSFGFLLVVTIVSGVLAELGALVRPDDSGEG